MADQSHITRAGARLISCPNGQLIVPADITGPTIILVPGFTAKGEDMIELGIYLSKQGFVCAIFEYDSYKGIDTSGKILQERLQSLADPLRAHGFVLLCHSMGGLVARYFIRYCPEHLRSAVRGLVFLGTPHRGTLQSSFTLQAAITVLSQINNIDPFWRQPGCRSALQLICKDSEQLIEDLNGLEQRIPLRIPYMSVSGGLRYLEVSEGGRFLINRVANWLIQKELGELGGDNDGLVAEHSADIQRITGMQYMKATHQRGYVEYSTTNHTALRSNQGIADMVVEFIRSEFQGEVHAKQG